MDDTIRKIVVGGSLDLFEDDYKDVDILALKLQFGMNPNTKGPYGTTALIEASAAGNTEIVELLLDAGADTEEEDVYGTRALMEASLNDSQITTREWCRSKYY